MRALYYVYTYYAIAFLFVHYIVPLHVVIINTIITVIFGESTVLVWVTRVPARGTFGLGRVGGVPTWESFGSIFRLARGNPEGRLLY